MKRLLQILLFVFAATTASAQQYMLSGRITGSHGEAVSFTSVYIRNSTYGTTANEEGKYEFKLAPGTYKVVYRMVGYREKVYDVTIAGRDQQLDVQLEDEIFTMTDTSHYVTKNDPGMVIMRHVLDAREQHMREFRSYRSSVYIKGVQRLVKAPKSLMGETVSRQLELDSLGKGILSQSESLSEFNFEQPAKFKEVTVASKSVGTVPPFSYNKASDLQLNIYNNVFSINGLSSHGFVSPVADNAFSFYRFKLVGRTVSNGRTINKIMLLPRHKHSPVFKGNIYVVDGDWRVYSVDLMLTKKTDNLNLIDTLQISQQFVPIRDSVWLPSAIQYSYQGDVLGFKFAGYYLGIYNNYQINQAFPDKYFNGEVLRVDTAANLKSSAYWNAVRPVPLTREEERDLHKKDSAAAFHKTDVYLDLQQHEKNRINYFSYLIFGYSASNRNERDSLYIFPFIQTFYYNTVEGFGINAKVRYTRTIDDYHSLAFTPAVRYGFGNKLFSANLLTEYKNDPFHNAKLWVNFGSDVLDLNNVGTRSLYFNTLSTLLYENNYVKYYRSQYGGFGYQRELANGVLWSGSLTYSGRQQLYNTSYSKIRDVKNKEFTSNNPLAPPGTPADDRSFLFPNHQSLAFNTSVAFTFDQQYITRPTGKFNLPSKYPTLTFNYRKGINKVLGSDVDYDFVSADISQYNMRIGLSGYSSFKLTGGDFLNNHKLYFMDYYHYLGNQGTTFDPVYIGSFHFLPFYTYSTYGGFFEAHYQHNFAGSILNKVPFLRKLKLEELVGGNFLTTRGNPSYREFYVGLQRLIFRVDYGVSYAGNKKYLQGIRIFYGIR